MKLRFKSRFISLLLCVSMLMPMLTQVLPVFTVNATGVEETERQDLSSNIGNQAVFDWWADFLLIDQDTLMNSTAAEISNYYGNSETGYENWVLYDDLSANDLVLKITDYHYDEENGFHWYKVTGEDLPDILQEKPWILYSDDIGLEDGYDPYLVIYDSDDEIRIINAAVNDITNVRFVLSGPEALADAEISITDHNDDYPLSLLSFAHEGNSSWSNALQVEITKANGTPWMPADGNVKILYTAEQIATDTYEEDILYGAAFLYVNGTVYSAAVTDRMGYDVSDIIYTNSGSSIIVFEFLLESFERIAATAYFTNESVTLYDNGFGTNNYLAAQLPAEFTAGYSFTYNNDVYYWLENDGFIGSPYFIAKASDVTLGELPEEYGDGRVTVTDKNGDAISEITLPQRLKPEFDAVSSLSKLTSDVKYQWQIEYEEGKWVDIYGEDSKNIKLTLGMVGTLLNEELAVNIRCKTYSALGTAYSRVIPVTLELYVPKEPDVVVSGSVTTSDGDVVTVTVAGSVPEDASVELEETDSSGVEVEKGEKAVASLDISIKNADGTEWQPESGETVTVSLPASSLGLSDGDSFVVYHLHNGEVKMLGTHTVVGDTVTFDVDGFSKFVFALAAQEQNFDDCIGKHAVLNAYNEWTGDGTFDYFWLLKDPSADTDSIYEWSVYDEDFEIDLVFKVSDYYIDSDNSLWFLVEPVNGLELPASLKERKWIYMNNVEQYDSEYDTLRLFEPEDISDVDLVIYDKYGMPTSKLYMYTDTKKPITAHTTLTGSVNYQWQVCYDVNNYLWMDISGQTSDALTLSYALLAGVIDENGACAVRCITSNAVETIESYPIIVSILERYPSDSDTYSLYNVYEKMIYAPAPALGSASEGIATAAEEVSTVLVTVQFVMGNNTAPIENGLFTYNVPYNGHVTNSIVIPTVRGYAAYLEDDRTTPLTGSYLLSETNVTESKTITIRFWPAEVPYKVVYMQQNILDDGYTVVRTDELVGLTDDDPFVENVIYEGFVLVWCDTDKIAADGSTTIEVKYDRLYFKMLFDLDGGYGVQPVYARYGTPVSVINPTKAGYIFMGWNAINGPYSDSNNETVDIDVFTDIEIPAAHTNYKALWQASETAKVTVVIWGQNANDDGYSYMADASKDLFFQAKPGTTVTYNPNGGYICGYDEEHTHGTGCEATCGYEEHIEHNDSCYTCGQTSHTHSKECYTVSGTGGWGNGDTYLGDAVTNGNTINSLNNATPDSNGIVSNRNFISTYYYIKIAGIWYRVVNYNSDNFSCTLSCGKNESTHVHTDDCINSTSSCPGIHIHNATCYDGCTKEEHTHVTGCTLTISGMKSTLWTYSHSDTVTVAADGSSTLNVYFIRKEFTLTFNYNYSNRNYRSVETITARWGENISDSFVEITNNAGSSFWATSNGGSTYVNYIGIMPQNNDEFWNRGATGSEGTMTYYGEGLDGGWDVLYSVSGVGGYNVTVEDRYEFEGYTYDHGTSTGEDCEGATFYYTRNSYNLVFDNYSTIEKTETVLFEEELADYGSFELDVSQAPVVYQPGSVKFKGWYLAPQTPNDFDFDADGDGKDDITPFDFASSKMPASDLKLYAWWEPISHTVTFYYDYDALLEGTIYIEDGEEKQFAVSNGGKIQDPYTPPRDPTSSYYSFVGWAYKTDDGTEILWDFDNSTVTEDVNLYGKWNSITPAEYTVKFVTVVDGKEIEIAEPIIGSALGGSTKTFDAKVNEDLYTGYQDRYYPHVMSHTITINLEDTSKNTFTFYYDYVEYTSYTIKYLNKETGDELWPTKFVSQNTHAMVTETFAPISGYLPDAYQKVCYIDSKGNNEIIFYYTKDDKNGLWTVHYWLENLDGTYTEAVDMLFTGTAAIGSTVTAPTDKVIENYYYYAAHTGNVSTGIVSIDDVVHLHMYYNRTVHDYTVKYLEAGTNKVLAPEKVVENLKWGTLITENAIGITNYQVYGSDVQSIEISVDDTENVIMFYYTEKRVTINYVAVGPDGATNFGTVTPGSESLAIISGVASGSVATASGNGYKFVGWYSDADCEDLLETDAIYVPVKDDGALWVDGTTYYAKFEYDLTSLTIKKQGHDSVDENQTFLFKITDADGLELTVTVHGNGSVTVDGLTIGKKYTIVEISEWSWRYTSDGVVEDATTVVITETPVTNGAEFTLNQNGNVITFANKRSNPYWLDGDSWCNNIFEG